MPEDRLTPKDHAEATALFRSEVIGSLARRELKRGEMRAALRALSAQRFRPPGYQVTRTFSVPTLERWYYAYRRAASPRWCPSAAPIVAVPATCPTPCGRSCSTFVASIRLPGAADPAHARRRRTSARPAPSRPRRSRASTASTASTAPRWPRPPATARLASAGRPSAPARSGTATSATARRSGPTARRCRFASTASWTTPLASSSALEAHHAERELDMLGILVAALRRHGPPDALYLDNGATYRGEALRLGCERLGVTLLHARPYDAQARGKMERFWLTLRRGCLDHLGSVASLHDVQVRLGAFLDQHYHRAPHAGLLGRAPVDVWDASEADRRADRITEDQLRAALTVRERRRVRRDTTVSVDGVDWQLDQGFLAGRIVIVARSLLDEREPPWVEHDDKRLPLHAVDPLANARRRRPPAAPIASKSAPVPFDPAGACSTEQPAGRHATPRHADDEVS